MTKLQTLSCRRLMKTSEKINVVPVTEFWKQVEAGKVPSPLTGFQD